MNQFPSGWTPKIGQALSQSAWFGITLMVVTGHTEWPPLVALGLVIAAGYAMYIGARR